MSPDNGTYRETVRLWQCSTDGCYYGEKYGEPCEWMDQDADGCFIWNARKRPKLRISQSESDES
jgi:hypothetical protein